MSSTNHKALDVSESLLLSLLFLCVHYGRGGERGFPLKRFTPSEKNSASPSP